MTIRACGCILEATMVGISKPTHINAHNKSTTGFTIVELLIVIVVIGILAALTLVAYNGVANKARDTQMKADLALVYKKLMIDKTLKDAYPATLAAADDGKGIIPSSGTYQYSVDNGVVPATFCVSYVKDGVGFFIDQNNVVTSGVCPGHSLSGTPVATPPTMGGYYNFSALTSMTNMTLPTDIPTGAWMIIIVGFTVDVDPVPSSGWSTLYPRWLTSTGTLRTMVFGKIKSSTEPATFSLTGSFSPNNAGGVLFWGTGTSSDLNSWVKSTTYIRNGTTAQQTTTTSPTITTTAAQSLVLSMSLERSSAMETDVTSIVGATKWFYVPQIDGNKTITILVSSAVLASPGTSTSVVVTYPNLQITNGTSFQIGLPPT